MEKLLESILQKIELVKTELELVKTEIRITNTKYDETIIDMVEMRVLLKASLLRRDIYSVNNDCNIQSSKVGGANNPTQRREAITVFWKRYYSEKMMESSDGKNIGKPSLNSMGITQDIIDHVRATKKNNKKLGKERFEMEGSHIWREISTRAKMDSKGIWAKVKENIENCRDEYQNMLNKQKTVPLQSDKILTIDQKPEYKSQGDINSDDECKHDLNEDEKKIIPATNDKHNAINTDNF